MLGNKILIIGCAGSGKTTLAKKLSSKLNLPMIHLDKYYWGKNWKAPETKAWEQEVLRLATSQTWIMDGNYATTLPIRLNYATSVVFLDMPRWKCLFRVILRRFRLLHNIKRQDIPSGCNERINLSFYQWIWNYPKRSRQKTLDMLANFKGSVYILKTNKDIDNFIRLIFI